MDEPKSKSQMKREANALQKVGVQLVALSLDKLDKLELPENLRQAIIDAKSIKGHGAIRRQAQLIGKLMRAADSESILAKYEQLQDESSARTAEFHEIEHWRLRLIEEGKDALTAYVMAYPMVDVQHLRQLIKKAQEEQNREMHTGASKALFRYLRSQSK